MEDTKAETTAAVAQILQMEVSVEQKKEAMRQLSMLVQTVSGILDGLVQRGGSCCRLTIFSDTLTLPTFSCVGRLVQWL